MITFVVQNETHAFNFAPVMLRLLELKVPASQLQIIHLDSIFGMDTSRLIDVPNQKTPQFSIPQPYYHLNGRQRLRWILKAQSQLNQQVIGTKVLVIGSDGAVQRVMANAVRHRKGKVIALFDGLLHPWPSQVSRRVFSQLKHLTQSLAAKGRLNHLVPGDVGHSNLDLIWVMNNTVKEILLDQKVRTPIEVVSLPRFDLYQLEFQYKRPDPRPEKRVLYATGSYKWHGQFTEHQWQQTDLVDLCEFAASHPEWQIRVRIHPREKQSDYTQQNWPSNVELSDFSHTVVEDLAWSSVLVTARSTMSVEAQIVGVPVLIYTRNFGSPAVGSYLARNPYLCRSHDLAILHELEQVSVQPSKVMSSVDQICQTLLNTLQ